MTEEEQRYRTAATMARIEQKVDSLSTSLDDHIRRTEAAEKEQFKKFEVIEDRVWNLSGSKLSTTSLLAIMTAIAATTAAIGTSFPHIFSPH